MSSKALKGQLLAAIAMTLVLTLALGSSTYAWFSMNTQVTATGMQVKAQAEGGIVISNEDLTEWTATATAKHSEAVALIPTSTDNLVNWYHNKSTDVNSPNAGQACEALGAVTAEEGTGLGKATPSGESTPQNIYLLNKFYVKSSQSEAATSAKFYINHVNVTGTDKSANLDAALRVGIKIQSQVFIYAPVTEATTSYSVNKSTSTTTCYTSTNKDVATTIGTIPGRTETPIEIQVFLYFEGEDLNCMSSNIEATLDTLSVELLFGTTEKYQQTT